MDDSDPDLLHAEVPARLAGQRFDKVLRELFEDLTGSELQRLVRRGKVKLDGQKVFRSNFRLRGGERIRVRVAAVQAAPALELELLHEEADYLVVDKPPGMLAHGNEKQRTGSVADLAVERFGALPSVEGDARPGIVHRLDRETSGVMVLARNERALEELRGQFERREVAKTYLALVHGRPYDDEFVVDQPLGPVPGQLDLQRIDPRGKSARTAFRVTRRLEAQALLECRPATGRRHQLRVHLASVGHPVVGDKLYRPEPGVERVAGASHHMLHAQQLEFVAPGTGRRVSYRADPPDSFMELVDALLKRP